jgi:hypothetical protein
MLWRGTVRHATQAELNAMNTAPTHPPGTAAGVGPERRALALGRWRLAAHARTAVRRCVPSAAGARRVSHAARCFTRHGIPRGTVSHALTPRSAGAVQSIRTAAAQRFAMGTFGRTAVTHSERALRWCAGVVRVEALDAAARVGRALLLGVGRRWAGRSCLSQAAAVSVCRCSFVEHCTIGPRAGPVCRR